MADTYLSEAKHFITKKRNSPFFLFFAPNENHVPRIVHPRFQGCTSLGPRGDAIAVFDWCVGELIESLKEIDQLNNTLIIITSDNGPVLFDGYWDGAVEKKGSHQASGPWRGGKYSRWEGGTRVPFIISWPGRVRSSISDALVSQVDLYASLAALKNLDKRFLDELFISISLTDSFVVRFILSLMIKYTSKSLLSVIHSL